METDFARFPVLTMFIDSLQRRNLPFNSYPALNGIEMRFLNEVKGMPNRAHLRIFFPNDMKCLLFFHKKSSIPFSRDRFSYGGVVIDQRSAARFNESDVEEWLDFVASGFQPGLRPRTIKKSIAYTIPED